MAIPTRRAIPGTYFISATSWERRPLFRVERNAKLFIECLEHYRFYFALHAFVVMPDHVHLLLTPHEIAMERSVQYIKGGFSRRYQLESGKKLGVWQRGYTDHRIRNVADFQYHVRYIHQNPVRAQLCAVAKEYPYSSAGGFWEMDSYLSG